MKDSVVPPPSVESLQVLLASLGIADPLQTLPESNPTTNPVDIFRLFIAKTLAPIGGVGVELIYSSLEWTQSFEKGDLILAIPRLRLKGRKPDEIAKEWAEKVSILCLDVQPRLTQAVRAETNSFLRILTSSL